MTTTERDAGLAKTAELVIAKLSALRAADSHTEWSTVRYECVDLLRAAMVLGEEEEQS